MLEAQNGECDFRAFVTLLQGYRVLILAVHSHFWHISVGMDRQQDTYTHTFGNKFQ